MRQVDAGHERADGSALPPYVRAERARHAERAAMVEEQIAARGIRDAAVLDAMRRIPREAFLPRAVRAHAYEDTALPIACDQTISQPYIVALMCEALELDTLEKPRAETSVLEVGTGSGYAAAVLAELCGHVYGIERHAALVEAARSSLDAVGIANVDVIHGDGSKGHPEAAPYDGISVAAGAPVIPEALREQLAIGGRLVIPVDEAGGAQQLVCVRRAGPATWHERRLGGVRFVPLVGGRT